MNSISILLTSFQVGATENQFVRAVLETGPFAKFILLIILLFSVVCWAAIFYKLWQFRRIARENEAFLDDFDRMGGDFGALCQRADLMRQGLAPLIFRESYRELRAVSQVRRQQLLFERSHLPVVQKRMERIVGQQIVRLEQHLILLATTANVCPFLGLLGTVWGILGTFMTMTNLESSLTLKLIGPGISEALTTTIFGLGAAIPAVIAYNYLVNRVAVFRMEMEDFAVRLLSVLEKNILARSAPRPARPPEAPEEEEETLRFPEQVTAE